MGQLYILEAGRADCAVIMTGEGRMRRVAVLDGGQKEYNGRAVLWEFLKSRGIRHTDLLILSHVHQDHFGGFARLENRVSVGKAVMPYGDILFPDTVATCFEPDECFDEYHTFYRWLEKCSAEIFLSHQCYQRRFPLEEDTFLRCLYPVTLAENVKFLNALCSGQIAKRELEVVVEGYKNTCNNSSSIWTLEKGGRTVALFSGDSTVETMEQCLPLPLGTPQVLKLSHHGINKNYFSVELIRKIAPEKHVVVCNDNSYYNEIKRECEEVCAAVGLLPYYTFQGDFSMDF